MKRNKTIVWKYLYEKSLQSQHVKSPNVGICPESLFDRVRSGTGVLIKCVVAGKIALYGRLDSFYLEQAPVENEVRHWSCSLDYPWLWG